GRERDRADLDRQAQVEHLVPVVGQRSRGTLDERGLGDDERAAAAPALGGEVPALDERGDRLAQRRARDRELLGEVALGRQPRARREGPETDRGAEPVDRLLERRRGLDRRQDGGGGGGPRPPPRTTTP